MKLYIVGSDGSGTEYSPSIAMPECLEITEGKASRSRSGDIARCFYDLQEARAYYKELYALYGGGTMACVLEVADK